MIYSLILTENAKTVTVDKENLKPAYDPAYIMEVRDAEPTLTHNETKVEGEPAAGTESGLSEGSLCTDCVSGRRYRQTSQ